MRLLEFTLVTMSAMCGALAMHGMQLRAGKLKSVNVAKLEANINEKLAAEDMPFRVTYNTVGQYFEKVQLDVNDTSEATNA